MVRPKRDRHRGARTRRRLGYHRTLLDTLAIQLKLNEIIGALHGASNQLIAIEDLSEDQLRQLHARYQRLMEMATERAARGSVSIEGMPPHPDAGGEPVQPPAIAAPAH